MDDIEIETKYGKFIVGLDPSKSHKGEFWIEVDHFSSGYDYNFLGEVTKEELVAIGKACLLKAGIET